MASEEGLRPGEGGLGPGEEGLRLGEEGLRPREGGLGPGEERLRMGKGGVIPGDMIRSPKNTGTTAGRQESDRGKRGLGSGEEGLGQAILLAR